MAGLGSVVVQFIGKDRLSSVAKGVSRAIDGTDDASGKARKGFGKLNAAWAAAIPVAGAVVGAGIAMGNALIDAGKAALEDKQSADKLAHTLGRIPGVTDAAIAANEDWISSMQLATLTADTDLRAAVGKLTLATGDLGQAQRLTTIAVDAAAGSGKNLSTITDALAKAANGQTGALQRQFPWLDKNKDGTLTLKEATDGLTEAYKGSAAEAQKTKPWELLTVIFDELKESVGAALLPILGELSAWFAKKSNQQKVKEFIDKVAELAETVGRDAVDAFKAWIEWLKNPANQQKLKDWAEIIGRLARALDDAVQWCIRLIDWMDRIPKPPSWITRGIVKSITPWAAAPAAAGGAATRAGSTTTTTTAAQPSAVIVTEEQIYRAVERLIMRGEARNGRLVRVG